MKVSVYYTAISVLNLLAFTVAVACLPAEVPIHYAHGVVDRLGSPWVFLALPAVSALLSLAVWAVRLKGKKTLPVLLLAIAGGCFSVLGWIFLGLSAQNAAFGDRVFFPYAAVTALPLSYLTLGCGVGLAPILAEEDTRFFEIAFTAAGGIGAVVSSALIAVPRLGWVALLVFFVLLLAAAVAVYLRLRALRRTPPQD